MSNTQKIKQTKPTPFDKVPFCDNPHCRFHAVKVLPGAGYIQREIPPAQEGGETLIERHTRFPYEIEDGRAHHFCEICATAIEMCRPQEQEAEIILPDKKLILAH